jgi:hypothetical protein
LIHYSSKEATELATNGPRFPWCLKLEALMVDGEECEWKVLDSLEISFLCKNCRSWYRSMSDILKLLMMSWPKKDTPITYYWRTVPLIFDHSYIVGKLRKFENCWYKSFRISEVLKLLLTAIFEFVKFPKRYEWSNIRIAVQ